MRRGGGALLGIAALVAFFAAVAALGLWIGRKAGEHAEAPAAEVVPTAATVAVPPTPGFAGVLPYAPATPLDMVGAFRLMDQDRNGVSPAELRGHYSLVFFGYTRCPRICASTVDNLSLLLDELGTAADGVIAYFITVDPLRDTRGAMAEYLRGQHPNVRGVTGTEEQVDAALTAFGVRREVQPPLVDGGYVVYHPGVVFFLGRDGRYKTHFREAMPAYEMAPIIRANW